jgi:hypothetical protein
MAINHHQSSFKYRRMYTYGKLIVVVPWNTRYLRLHNKHSIVEVAPKPSLIVDSFSFTSDEKA